MVVPRGIGQGVDPGDLDRQLVDRVDPVLGFDAGVGRFSDDLESEATDPLAGCLEYTTRKRWFEHEAYEPQGALRPR